ncbi:MAG: WbqC family protein [Desulfobacterales bacterium]|nr:WbqC family protein [Desulfobacterales bacterium]
MSDNIEKNCATSAKKTSVIGILQPGYLPWLGFFEQLYRSDVFVIYDDVQYDRNGWRNRNRIKTANGMQWLTIPVHCKFEDHPLVSNIKIDNKTNWGKKHLLSLKINYSKSPFFSKYIDIFEDAYSRMWGNLIDINMHFILELSRCLGLSSKKIIRSSTLNITGEKTDRLIKICKMFSVDVFYEGSAGKNYIDENLFNSQGIRIEYQNYNHPVYKQLYGDFMPYLSVVDLLFNHGDESLSILTNKRSAEVSK